MTNNMDDEIIYIASDHEDCVEPSVTKTKLKIISKSFTDEGVLNKSHSLLSGNNLTFTKRRAPSNIEGIPQSKKSLLTNEMISSITNGVPFTRKISTVQQHKNYIFIKQGNVLKRLVGVSTNNGANLRNKLSPIVGQFTPISTLNDIRLPYTVNATTLAGSQKSVMPIISKVYSLSSAIAVTNTTMAVPLKDHQRVTLSMPMPKPNTTTSATKTSFTNINNHQSVSSQYKEMVSTFRWCQQRPCKYNISSSIQPKKSLRAYTSLIDSSSKPVFTPKFTYNKNCVEEINHSRKQDRKDTCLKIMNTFPKLGKSSSRSTELEIMDVKELKKPYNSTKSQCLKIRAFKFLTKDIVQATCSRLLVRGMKAKQSNTSAEESQREIIIEFGRCFDKIISTVPKKSCIKDSKKSVLLSN